MTNTVISICSLGHADVWKLTSKLLPEMVQADEYMVYVPQDEIEQFNKITDRRITVKAQEDLGLEFAAKLKKACESVGNEVRFGWYLQQFYKIAALQLSDSDVVTIWDADCVPVSKIETMNDLRQVVYVNSSREYHVDYFENISRLLEMERVQDFSFVIPSFPMKQRWVADFIAFIETKHRLKWYEAIISTTNFSLRSGFSETETLGTWVANNYPDEWSSRLGTWERFGQSRFGYARNLSTKALLKLGRENNLEIITFENWDLRGFKRIIRKFKSLLKKNK